MTAPLPLIFFWQNYHDYIPCPSHSKYTKRLECGCYLAGAVLFLVNLVWCAARPLIWASFSRCVTCFSFWKTHLQWSDQLENWHVHPSVSQKQKASLFCSVPCMDYLLGVFHEPTPEIFHIFLHLTTQVPLKKRNGLFMEFEILVKLQPEDQSLLPVNSCCVIFPQVRAGQCLGTSVSRPMSAGVAT